MRHYRGARRTGSLRTKRHYDSYIGSPAWRARREQWVLIAARDNSAGIVCEVCGLPWMARKDDLHHLEYRRLGTERHEDLVPVHRVAHDEIHRLIDGLRLTRQLPLAIANRHIIHQLQIRNFDCAAAPIKY